MIEVLLTLLAILGAIIASYTDIKKGIIPNALTMPLIIIGIVGSILTGSLYPCIKGLIMIFIVGYFFWILGGWSAGDVKEFLFIAALIPRYPEFLKKYFSPILPSYPFVLTVFINTFLAVFPIILGYAFYLSIKKRIFGRFLEPLRDAGKIARSVLIFGLAYASILTLLGYEIDVVQYIITVFLFSLLFHLFWNSMKILRTEALQEEIPISLLREGDVLAEEIYLIGDKVVRDNRSLSEKFKEIMKNPDILKEDKNKKIIANTKAAGVEKKEIEILRKLVDEGKLEDRIRIKKSTPFAPAILAGLVISLFFGDILTMIKL